MPRQEAEYKEVDRLSTGDTTTVILSEVRRKGTLAGYTLTKYVESEGWTGYVKGGPFVPADLLIDFLKMFPYEELKLAVDQLRQENKEPTEET